MKKKSKTSNPNTKKISIISLNPIPISSPSINHHHRKAVERARHNVMRCLGNIMSLVPVINARAARADSIACQNYDNGRVPGNPRRTCLHIRNKLFF